jgi:hypothetical protein
MRRNLLITSAAAALLAGTMFAAAQQSQGGANVARDGARVQAQGETQTDQGQQKGKAQRSQKKQEQTQGQGERSQNRTQGQGTGEAQRDDGKAPKKGQAQRNNESQQGQTQRNNESSKDAQRSGSGGSGSVTLSTEQRTKIRTTVLQSKNAPRVTNVNFTIRVGTVVPRDRVRLVTVSPVLVEIHPEWRGYVYFIVNDQIIIVEPRSYKIVAVLVV